MTDTAEKTDPALWDKVKQRVTAGSKGGKPGEWSARKAQMAVAEYKHEGGGYKGKKTADNHLATWTREEWDTKSGENSAETGERYLPKQAREALSGAEYARTTRKKQEDTRKGHQFSAQPSDIARKTAQYRSGAPTKAALMQRAAAQGIRGRSRMSKDELEKALEAKP